MKRVVLCDLVLDVLFEDVEAVDFRGEPRGDRGARLVADLRDLAGRARGVGGDDRPDAELADHLAALAERVDVAFDGLDVFDGRALHRQQLVPHRHEMLADDVQVRIRHQVVDVGDAAGDRVLDRDHAERRFARRDRGERVLEGRARQRLRVRIDLADREMRVRAGLALECDLHLCHGPVSPTVPMRVNACRARGAPSRDLPACRRRAARCRRPWRRSACRPPARGAARAARAVRAARASARRTFASASRRYA